MDGTRAKDLSKLGKMGEAMPVDAGLSDLLPAGDPFADFDPTPFVAGGMVTSEITVVSQLPQAIVAQPVVEEGSVMAEAAAIGLAPRPSKRIGKKRRSWAGVFLALTVVGLFAGLVGCLILLVNGKVITTDGDLVATQDVGGGPKIIAGTDGLDAKPARDPVMGALDKPRDVAVGDSGRRQGMLDPNLQPGSGVEPMNLGGDAMPDKEEDANKPSMEPESEKPMIEGEPEAGQEPASSEPMEAAAPETPEQEMGEENPKPSEGSGDAQMLSNEQGSPMFSEEQWQEELNEVRGLLLAGSYAEAQLRIESIPEGGTPRDEAIRLGYGRLAVLAEYYAEGIRDGSEKLNVAETFDLPGGITVAVVESSRESISLKIEGRVRRYDIADLPLVLADQLAAFGLPMEEPVVQAGKAAFATVWAHATPEHRKQAIEALSELHTRDNQLSADAMVSAIQHMVENSAGR